MKIVRLFVVATLAVCAVGRAWAGPNPFFAMNTIAKGGPDEVVPLLKELGYDGLGGAAGDGPMATALERAGLKFFNGYVTLQLAAERSPLDEKLRGQIDAMRRHHTALWVAISKVLRAGKPLTGRTPEGDDLVARQVKEIADYAAARGVKVALYPHTAQYLEHFEDVMQMADRLNHPNVGTTFNLCHWLRVEGSERDPAPLLQAARPRLMFVTINGADTGETKTMNWSRLILPLGEGSYDVGAFLRKVRAAGFAGPVGFQGYGIKEPPREVLAKTMTAWKRMQAERQ